MKNLLRVLTLLSFVGIVGNVFGQQNYEPKIDSINSSEIKIGKTILTKDTKRSGNVYCNGDTIGYFSILSNISIDFKNGLSFLKGWSYRSDEHFKSIDVPIPKTDVSINLKYKTTIYKTEIPKMQVYLKDDLFHLKIGDSTFVENKKYRQTFKETIFLNIEGFELFKINAYKMTVEELWNEENGGFYLKNGEFFISKKNPYLKNTKIYGKELKVIKVKEHIYVE